MKCLKRKQSLLHFRFLIIIFILVRTANYTTKYVTKNVVNKSLILTNISFYLPSFNYTAAVFL